MAEAVSNPPAEQVVSVERLVRVLLVEDDEDDYVLTRELLAEIPGYRFDLEWMASYEDALKALGQARHDVYLFDYRLGRHNGLELLAAAVARGCKAPVILLTGQGEREIDLEAMRTGAADYLVKGKIDGTLLERSIRHAIERKRDQDALRQMHADLEVRVRERTAELARANEALQAEIRKREKLSQELQRRNEELAEASQHKDEFLATLAHELRNPLAPIRNALQILRLAGNDQQAADQAREMMERQVRQMVRLVDDLLDVSRITRGKIDLRKERIDLSAVIESALETSRPLIEAARHELTVTLPPGPLYVEGDLTRLAQVVSNLLNNSSKYTPEGGRIGLTVARDGNQAVLRVRDTGMGIPPEMLARIFEMFAQMDRTLDRAQGGLGIGLTLVRKLVQMHGGSVVAHSDGPGKGSEFVVRLPLVPGQREPATRVGDEGEGEGQDAPGRGRRVLVVDDNVDSANSLGLLLQIMGSEVRIAHDGPEALVVAAAFRPGVVLLDIGLPSMDGYEVARQLRTLPGLEDVVLVAQTGWGQEEDRRRSDAAGFHHHLVKPVEPEALQELLAGLPPQ